MDFSGFEDLDFDAFAPEKWKSHAYNRERLEVKLKLKMLGNQLKNNVQDFLKQYEMGMTEERPSVFNQQQVDEISLFFIRDADAQHDLEVVLNKKKTIAESVFDPALHHRHISLGVSIYQDGIEAGLWLHRNAWADWKNLLERCREYWERDLFKELIDNLPMQILFSQGMRLSPDAKPARKMEVEQLFERLAHAEAWNVWGERFERTDPLVASSALVGRIGSLFENLMPLYRFICWTKDNDFHHLKDTLKQHQEKASQKFSTIKTGDQVRILQGIAAGRIGVVESMEKKGLVKVRLGKMVIGIGVEELASV